MGIDILFPIVRARLLFPSDRLSFLSPSCPPFAPRPTPIPHPSAATAFFFGRRTAFFSIIILFRIQSIISISIVLRYFHLASHSERDETTQGRGEGEGGFAPASPASRSLLPSSLSLSFPLTLSPARRCPRSPSDPRSPCSPVCVRCRYNDGVAGDDSLMRLNINSHFVDAPLLHFSGIFSPSRGIVGPAASARRTPRVTYIRQR